MRAGGHRTVGRGGLEPWLQILKLARFNPSKWLRGLALAALVIAEGWYAATADIRVGLFIGAMAFYLMRDALGHWTSDPTMARCRAIVVLDIAVLTLLVGIVANVARYGVGPWDIAAAAVAVAYVLVMRSVRASIRLARADADLAEVPRASRKRRRGRISR